MRVFVPIEDDLSDAAFARLVPYRCGLDCWHALGRDEVPGDSVAANEPPAPLSDGSSSCRPTGDRSSAPRRR